MSGRSCATRHQVGKELKEPVTRWHRAARSHLYCRNAIVVLVSRSAGSVASFVASGTAASSATPAFTAVLVRPHVTTDKTNKRENRSFLLVLPRLLFCILLFHLLLLLLPSSSSSVSVYRVSTVHVFKRLMRPKRKFHDVLVVENSAKIIPTGRKLSFCFSG